ncbi:MAG: glycosyltransferase [Candidatus Moraniibacteriota bacterium]
MRIAIFSDTFPPEVNGVANFVYLSANALANKGHEVRVFTASRISQKKLNEKIGKKFKIFTGLSVHSPIYSDSRVPLPTGISFPYLLKFRPDIIHANTPFTLGWGAVMGAKILRVPLIGTHHTFYDHYLKHAKIDFSIARKATWKYTISFYNFCDLVTTPSHSLLEEMKEHRLKKPVVVLPNFVNTHLFKPADHLEKNKLKKHYKINGKSLVYMGRLSYEKSIDQVVKAFKLALPSMPNLKLMIIGDGPERENLEKLASKLSIRKKVIFTGFLRGENLAKALQANDIFTTASKTETFCISALEAMAVGLPVILASKKGLRELVKSNKNGYLTRPDKPRELANKIIEIFSNENNYKKLAMGARVTALNYSRENVIEKLEKLYIKISQNNK